MISINDYLSPMHRTCFIVLLEMRGVKDIRISISEAATSFLPSPMVWIPQWIIFLQGKRRVRNFLQEKM